MTKFTHYRLGDYLENPENRKPMSSHSLLRTLVGHFSCRNTEDNLSVPPRQERHINQNEIETTAVYEDTDSDISSIRSGVSLGNVTVASFHSDIEVVELQDLSVHQLKDLSYSCN